MDECTTHEAGSQGGTAPFEPRSGLEWLRLVRRARSLSQRWLRVAETVDPVPEAEDERYQERIQKFERVEGKILGAYWCTTAESAVALTVKSPSGRFRLLRRPHTRIHRVSDWVVPEHGEAIAELLHYCDALAIKASAVLTGTPARIVMQWIFAIESDLLGFIERSDGVLARRDVTSFVGRVKRELLRVERYYDDAGNKTARLFYFFGMLSGVVFLTGIGTLAGVLVWLSGVLASDRTAERTIFICLAAGGYRRRRQRSDANDQREVQARLRDRALERVHPRKLPALPRIDLRPRPVCAPRQQDL